MVSVMVVDDSPLIQERLERLLGALPGVQVVGFAADAAGAIAQIDTKRPDIVVLDVQLRGHDRGMSVLQHVTRRHPCIRVVALSNFQWEAMREGFLRAGASVYFDKAMEFGKACDWIAAVARTAGCDAGEALGGPA